MISGHRTSRWLFLGLILLIQESLCALSPFVESMIDDVKTAIDEPIQVNRKNGSSFIGDFGGLSSNGVRMSQKVGFDGVVEVEINWDEIDSVCFAGDSVLGEVFDLHESENYQATIEILLYLYNQRAPFFTVVPDSGLLPFVYLADSYLKTGLSTEALGVVRTLKPNIDDIRMLKDIEDIELLSYMMLGLDAEAIALSKTQIENANDPSTASLAWVALAFHHLNKKNYREAWLCAVHPILFDRRLNSPDLADAYLAAMIATLKMNRAELALSYHQQFSDRGLELTEKSYQKLWLHFFNTIQWQTLATASDEIEKFADLESRIDSHTEVSENNVPILKIPLTLD